MFSVIHLPGLQGVSRLRLNLTHLDCVGTGEEKGDRALMTLTFSFAKVLSFRISSELNLICSKEVPVVFGWNSVVLIVVITVFMN